MDWLFHWKYEMGIPGPKPVGSRPRPPRPPDLVDPWFARNNNLVWALHIWHFSQLSNGTNLLTTMFLESMLIFANSWIFNRYNFLCNVFLIHRLTVEDHANMDRVPTRPQLYDRIQTLIFSNGIISAIVPRDWDQVLTNVFVFLVVSSISEK